MLEWKRFILENLNSVFRTWFTRKPQISVQLLRCNRLHYMRAIKVNWSHWPERDLESVGPDARVIGVDKYFVVGKGQGLFHQPDLGSSARPHLTSDDVLRFFVPYRCQCFSPPATVIITTTNSSRRGQRMLSGFWPQSNSHCLHH